MRERERDISIFVRSLLTPKYNHRKENGIHDIGHIFQKYSHSSLDALQLFLGQNGVRS